MPPVSVRRNRPAGRTMALLAVFAGLAGSPAVAQGPSGAAITPIQGLGFGQLIAGVPEVVPPTDVMQRASFAIEGDRKMNLQLTLPTILRSVSGAVIPLAFGSSDGILALQNRPSAVFNPNTGVAVNFNKNRDVGQVYLGGVASPTANQAAGNYSATVTIILIDPKA